MSENSNTEYKSRFSDAVIETLVAFANTKGGQIFIGINDDGEPVKNFVIREETVQQWLNEIKHKTQPSVIPDSEFLEIEGKEIISLSIKEFPIKPVAFRGRYFKRVQNSNHQLNLREISDMHLKTFNTSWDSYATNDYKLDDISLEKVRSFIEKSNILKENPLQDDPLTVLYKFELIKESQIANACHLLFAKNDVFLATIELGRFSAPTLIKDGLTLRSDLFSQIEDVLTFIKKHINKEYIITGNPQREERWEYPLNAIREIIINMIVHRDYMHYGDSSVKVFDHYIEFFNPGPLPQSISIEQLLSGDYTSQARNKKVSSIFKEAGVIEKYGSGIKRIQNAFLNYGLEAPVFENFQHGFRVIVSTQTVLKTVEKTVEETVEKTVEKTEEIILNLIKSDSRITTKAIQQITGLSRRGIEWQIQKLKDQKIINRIGPDKGGHWEIIK
ncbi:RNA-binding domain-containing protein [Dyadobacter subterraneus]|uniref:DNA binding domain-containing protein n=1 Tax=Dyadobacter subterraneus TaxID=2773304 RepID=A0ABR9WKV1_9BACT|nr:RNA-binding domain-containing protein [Dyadobacter subterraneus]MBE9464794.1 putative DNA binding domain-containing protein [Dyadobacter subterraneus]